MIRQCYLIKKYLKNHILYFKKEQFLASKDSFVYFAKLNIIHAIVGSIIKANQFQIFKIWKFILVNNLMFLLIKQLYIFWSFYSSCYMNGAIVIILTN
jgi:hypothetical protein